MHFRDRSSMVQVIRSKYDPATKRAKTEIVGRIMKSKPELSDALRSACNPAEIREVEAWLGGFDKVQKLKAELAAKTLGEQIDLAGEWFATQKGEDAKMLAANLALQWGQFRGLLKKQNLTD